MSLVLVGCVALQAAGLPGVSRAAERGAAAELGLGVASVICTVGYGIAKTIYALGGSATGGLAYVFTGGRQDVARAVVQPAVRGDYVVTPDHLTGVRPLEVAGRDPLTTTYPR